MWVFLCPVRWLTSFDKNNKRKTSTSPSNQGKCRLCAVWSTRRHSSSGSGLDGLDHVLLDLNRSGCLHRDMDAPSIEISRHPKMHHNLSRSMCSRHKSNVKLPKTCPVRFEGFPINHYPPSDLGRRSMFHLGL